MRKIYLILILGISQILQSCDFNMMEDYGYDKKDRSFPDTLNSDSSMFGIRINNEIWLPSNECSLLNGNDQVLFVSLGKSTESDSVISVHGTDYCKGGSISSFSVEFAIKDGNISSTQMMFKPYDTINNKSYSTVILKEPTIEDYFSELKIINSDKGTLLYSKFAFEYVDSESETVYNFEEGMIYVKI